jgi:Mrp family chromosome partitioning ATPase
LQKANSVAGAIVVTTPEEVSLADVRKELNFCQKTKVPILGLIENMGQYTTSMEKLLFSNQDGTDCTQAMLAKLKEMCPEVLEKVVTANIHPVSGGGPKKMAEAYNVPFWGSLPMDPDLLECCEDGQAYVEKFPASAGSKTFVEFCNRITTTLPVEEVKE